MSTEDSRFRQTVEKYIQKHQLLHRSAPVLVALSGGADSVALLAVLVELGYDCRAAHCNFHLRGEESQRDMRHCSDICKNLGIDLTVRHFDVAAYIGGHGGSVEMACRELRYRWFGELLHSLGAQAVAVGHHSEDRAETFLLNLMRGTGIAGLTSMRPRSGDIVRPLLSLTRADIETYLAEKGLAFITDSSNASDAHRRNRLRNTIIPALDAAFPGAVSAIVRTIDNLEKTESVYRSAVAGIIAGHLSEGTVPVLDIAGLARHKDAETALYEFLSTKGFTATQAANILANPLASGTHFTSADGIYTAELDRGTLTVMPSCAVGVSEETYPVDLHSDITEPVHIEVTLHPAADFAPENAGAGVAYFDAAAKDCRWILRHPRTGDRMIPFGAKKSKLLSDIFSNAKLSAAEKRRQWVLECDGEIAWLPGLKNSALWSIRHGATEQYIRLYFK